MTDHIFYFTPGAGDQKHAYFVLIWIAPALYDQLLSFLAGQQLRVAHFPHLVPLAQSTFFFIESRLERECGLAVLLEPEDVGSKPKFRL